VDKLPGQRVDFKPERIVFLTDPCEGVVFAMMGDPGLACVCAAAAPPSLPGIPPDPSEPANYKWEKLAEGIQAFIAPPGITPMVAGNSS